MMRSAGSNKFIDSEKGENNTREVAGKTAMNVAQLATLDLVGFLTNAALNSQIENEPLSEKTHIFIRVKANSIDEAKSEAVQYLESLIGDSSFTVKDKKEWFAFTKKMEGISDKEANLQKQNISNNISTYKYTFFYFE